NTDVLLDVPRRHDTAVGPDRGALFDRLRPWPRVVVADERHRGHAVGTVTVLTAPLQDGSNVLGEGHVVGDVDRFGLQGHDCRHERQRSDRDRAADHLSDPHYALSFCRVLRAFRLARHSGPEGPHYENSTSPPSKNRWG